MHISLGQSKTTFKLQARYLLWAGSLLLCLGLAAWLMTTQRADHAMLGQVGTEQALFEGQTGIRIVRVTLTAANGLADLHYQVLDPDKALIVHDRAQPPAVVHGQSGAVLNRPFHAHGFQTLKAGVTYRLQLWNDGRVLQRGDRITVRVGDAQLGRVTIE